MLKNILVLIFFLCFPISSIAQQIKLEKLQAQEIGNKIWQNEGLKKKDNLTVWNKGEEFPSLGIGHFIWYPEGVEKTFIEQFPQFIQHLQKKRPDIIIPEWLLSANSPWSSREEFYAQFDNQKLQNLRHLLAGTISEQTHFIILRMEKALPKMLVGLDKKNQEIITQRFYRVAEEPNGPYALIDYINFKGEGTASSERYQGQGWGLLQVLTHMEPNTNDVMKAFAASANLVLTRRVHNAPRDESRWLKGWRKRLQTYLNP